MSISMHCSPGRAVHDTFRYLIISQNHQSNKRSLRPVPFIPNPLNRSRKTQRRPSIPVAQHIVADIAVALDEAPAWTLDQIAGLVFAFLLVGFYLSATQIDKYVAKSQRRQLGLCEECGGLYNTETCRQNNCPLKK